MHMKILKISSAHVKCAAWGYQGSLCSFSPIKKKVKKLYPIDSNILSNLSPSYSILSGHIIFNLLKENFQAARDRI